MPACAQALTAAAECMETVQPEKRSREETLTEAEDGVERTCSVCGATDTPKWRRGTMCNACGLRDAKTARTRAHADGAHTLP